MTHIEVVAMTATDIRDLRIKVLRKNTPDKDCNYPEDNLPDVVHLGVRRDGVVIGTSTWFARECPNIPAESALQLKGMAVDDDLQGSGIGAAIIAAGVAHATDCCVQLIWARARDSALGFYERNGFTMIGNGYGDGPTGMPHHNVFRRT